MIEHLFRMVDIPKEVEPISSFVSSTSKTPFVVLF